VAYGNTRCIDHDDERDNAVNPPSSPIEMSAVPKLLSTAPVPPATAAAKPRSGDPWALLKSDDRISSKRLSTSTARSLHPSPSGDVTRTVVHYPAPVFDIVER
jgi:hypothetical protein